MVKVDFDFSGWKQGIAQLADEKLTSLARSMAVAGGSVLRDEAKRQAPVEEGILRDSIYLAFKDGKSNDAQVVYSVTWNSKKAPHGHLLEFGHWQPYKVVKLPNGDWFTTTEKLAAPKFTAAKPFLRPAFDIAKQRAATAMIERGKQRLPELLAGNTDGD